MHRTTGAFRPLLDFAHHILALAGRRGVVAVALLILGSLVEGATILLLLPVLRLVGPEGSQIILPLPHWVPRTD